MKFYIVFFDRNPALNYQGFHKDFVAHPQITKWWHYIKSAYIVGTDLSVKELSLHTRGILEKYQIPNTHLVLSVDLKERQGMLTPEAWKWIRDSAQLS